MNKAEIATFRNGESHMRIHGHSAINWLNKSLWKLDFLNKNSSTLFM